MEQAQFFQELENVQNINAISSAETADYRLQYEEACSGQVEDTLHTWGSTMNFHPHIHAIVLGGGQGRQPRRAAGRISACPCKIITAPEMCIRDRGVPHTVTVGRCITVARMVLTGSQPPSASVVW